MSLPILLGLKYTFAKKGGRQKGQLVSFLSGVSICGLVLGVGLLIAVLSIMNGFDRELREKILGLVPQATITHIDGIKNWKEVVDQLESSPDIIAAAPFIQTYGLVAKGKEAKPAVIYGIDHILEQNVSLITRFVGVDTLTTLNTTDDAIILGFDLASSLKVEEGDRIMLVVPSKEDGAKSAKTGFFKIIRIIQTKTELDASLALTSLNGSRKFLSNPNTVSGIRLSLVNIFNAPYVVYSNIRVLGNGYSGNSWINTHGNLHHAIKMSKNLVGILMSLIVAIAAFNVVATLILVVVDKQGDIAILRTLGLTTYQVMGVFIVQGSAIGALGTLLGIAFGCGLSLVAQDIVSFIEAVFNVQFLKSDVYPLTYLPSEILISDVLQVASTALMLCFLATIYPAWKASRIEPAQALRYE